MKFKSILVAAGVFLTSAAYADTVALWTYSADRNGIVSTKPTYTDHGGASFSTAATLPAGGSTLIRTAPDREGDVWVPLNGNGLTRSTNSGASFSKIANVTSCSAVGFGKAMNGAGYPTVFIWGSVSGSSARDRFTLPPPMCVCRSMAPAIAIMPLTS